jgi:hypothetical protein
MMHDLEQRERETPCSLVRRLDDIRMSESERRAAIEYMRRGERVAACILALARLTGIAGRLLRRLTATKARTRTGTRTT